MVTEAEGGGVREIVRADLGICTGFFDTSSDVVNPPRYASGARLAATFGGSVRRLRV